MWLLLIFVGLTRAFDRNAGKYYMILPEAARNLTNVTFYKVGLIIDQELQDLQGTITAMGFAEARIRREKVIPLDLQFE